MYSNQTLFRPLISSSNPRLVIIIKKYRIRSQFPVFFLIIAAVLDIRNDHIFRGCIVERGICKVQKGRWDFICDESEIGLDAGKSGYCCCLSQIC